MNDFEDLNMEYELEELFDLQMGKTPARNKAEYWNGQKIESEEASPEEIAEMERLLNEITGG